MSFLQKFADQTLPNLQTTKAQAILLILTYVVAARLSWNQVDGLLKLVNGLFGCEVLPATKYMLRKLWNLKQSRFLKFHYFCKTCTSYLGAGFFSTKRDKKLKCEVCHQSFTIGQLVSNGSFYFIFDIRSQLQRVIAQTSEELYKSLKEWQSTLHSHYTDITDGKLYQRVRQSLALSWSDITMSFNTDGAVVFKSAKHSMWPIQLTVNELPVMTRWQHILLGGLWFSKKHPPLHLLIKSFVKEFNNIGHITWCHGSERIHSFLYTIFCFVDSPARAVLLNMKQYNGYQSCSWCMEFGTLVEGKLLSHNHGMELLIWAHMVFKSG